jgi:hypothetical protein
LSCRRWEPSAGSRSFRSAVVVACIQDEASLVKYSLRPGSFVASAKRVHSAVRFRHSCAFKMVTSRPIDGSFVTTTDDPLSGWSVAHCASAHVGDCKRRRASQHKASLTKASRRRDVTGSRGKAAPGARTEAVRSGRHVRIDVPKKLDPLLLNLRIRWHTTFEVASCAQIEYWVTRMTRETQAMGRAPYGDEGHRREEGK